MVLQQAPAKVCVYGMINDRALFSVDHVLKGLNFEQLDIFLCYFGNQNCNQSFEVLKLYNNYMKSNSIGP